jgi:hypothetical protein
LCSDFTLSLSKGTELFPHSAEGAV